MKTRKIKYLLFNEANVINFSMYNVILCALVFGAVESIEMDPETRFIFGSCIILIGTSKKKNQKNHSPSLFSHSSSK